jgi:hypothetical protein
LFVDFSPFSQSNGALNEWNEIILSFSPPGQWKMLASFSQMMKRGRKIPTLSICLGSPGPAAAHDL